MNEKLINIIFFFIGISLVFNNIPRLIQLNLLGGPFGNKLTIYFFIIGFMYTIYYQCKKENIFIEFENFKKYMCIYFCIVIFSLVLGLCFYPYYDVILEGPITQIEKMPKIINFLHDIGIYIDEKLLLIIFMIIRVIKNTVLEIIYTFCFSYIIFCWYYNNWKKGLKILNKAVIFSICIIIIYCIIETFYLAGNKIAFNILEVITPYIHAIKDNSSWWPPLFWEGQIRSVFAEPSYFGVYVAFAMPFLWYNLMISKKKDKIIYFVFFISMCFFLFLTKSRTAIILFLGETIFFIILLCYLKNKLFFKKLFLIISCIVIAFFGSNIFISNTIGIEKFQTHNGIKEYVEDNITSVVSTKERSNTARYSIILANLKIGFEHPLLGVGTNLRHGYIPEYLPKMSENSKEINKWLINQKKEGILKATFPSLGEYSTRFAENGIVGLIIFLVPFVILLFKFIKIILNNKSRNNEKLIYGCYSISLIAIFISGIGDGLNITSCYWVLLGLGYAMCFSEYG